MSLLMSRRRLLGQGGLVVGGAALTPTAYSSSCPEPTCSKEGGWTMALLLEHLQAAVNLELATIPAYLSALYSIRDPNSHAYIQIRSVVIEEMLHLQLACNLLLSVGGSPSLTGSNAPTYPAGIPARTPGEKIFVEINGVSVETPSTVSLGPVSQESLLAFVAIEVPSWLDPNIEGHITDGPVTIDPAPGPISCAPEEDGYHSIGEFYDALAYGMEHLYDTGVLFFRDPALQTTAYGRDDVRVQDLDSAKQAIFVITSQGEGGCTTPYLDLDGQASHYSRFLDILEQHMDEVTGADRVRPVADHTTQLALREEDTALGRLSRFFDAAYSWTLQELEAGLNGSSGRVSAAIGGLMFQVIKPLAIYLMDQPIPGSSGLNAGPCFLYSATNPGDLQRQWDDLDPTYRGDLSRVAAALGLNP